MKELIPSWLLRFEFSKIKNNTETSERFIYLQIHQRELFSLTEFPLLFILAILKHSGQQEEDRFTIFHLLIPS